MTHLIQSLYRRLRRLLPLLLLPVAAGTASLAAEEPGDSTAAAAPSPPLTLETIRRAAEEHFPLLRQREVMEEVVRESSRAMKYVHLPQVSIGAGANYLTDIPRISAGDLVEGGELKVAMPSALSELGLPQQLWDGMMTETMTNIGSQLRLPTIPKLQYGISLSVAQLLWDGGEAAAHGRALAASQEGRNAQTDQLMREVRQAVTEIYFALLRVDARTTQSEELIGELERQTERVRQAMANDVATQAEADEVRVELLQAMQDQAVLREARIALTEALTIYTGLSIDETTELQLPPTPAEAIAATDTIGNGRIVPLRPEHRLFDAQIAEAQASYDRYRAGLFPQMMLYGIAAYSDPYPNFFQSGAHPFGMVGLTFRWTFGQYYGLDAQRKSLSGTTEVVEMERSAFEQKSAAELAQARRKVERCAEQMRLDEEIVDLRRRIHDRSEVQTEEGVMTRREALGLLTRYHTAESTAEIHRIDYLEALYELADLQR